jgi:hypothetical protein
VGMGHNTRCGRERILTERESAIRARFVRDSFHDGSNSKRRYRGYALMIEQQRGNVIDYTSTADILLLRRYGQHFGSFPKPANRRLIK